MIGSAEYFSKQSPESVGERHDGARPFGIFAAKALFTATVFGGAATVAGFAVVDHAKSQADVFRHDVGKDAEQFRKQAMIDGKIVACSTGNQLMINFNNVSVDPLIAEAAGIKEFTGNIARSLPTTTVTTIAPGDTKPEERLETDSSDFGQTPPTSALMLEGSSEVLSLSCPELATPTVTTTTTLSLSLPDAPPTYYVDGQQQAAPEPQLPTALTPQG